MKELIKYIRNAAQMSQEQFAAELGTTTVSINRWENGKSLPNQMAQRQLVGFCKAHNVNAFDLVVGQAKVENGNLILYHGSKKGIVGEIAPISREMCDFGRGFYMGTDPSQPLTLICDENKPIFYTLEFDTSGLNVLDIDIGLDWAMLIAYYRGYMDEVKGTAIYNKYESFAKGYDVILGYIANDRMYRVMTSFFEKEITDVALISCLKALDLGRQYVAVTPRACKQIKIVETKQLLPLELAILKDRSEVRRSEGISRTDEILLQHRREGKFFDEILRGEL